MEMHDRKHTGKGLINPLCTLTSLAFGAVAIATGVVGNPLGVPTGAAEIKMSSESGGPAGAETKQHLALPKGSPMLAEKSIPMLSDDIGDFKLGTRVSHLIKIRCYGFFATHLVISAALPLVITERFRPTIELTGAATTGLRDDERSGTLSEKTGPRRQRPVERLVGRTGVIGIVGMGKSWDKWNGETQNSEEIDGWGVSAAMIELKDSPRTKIRWGKESQEGMRTPRGGEAHAWPAPDKAARTSCSLGRGTTGIREGLPDQKLTALRAWR